MDKLTLIKVMLLAMPSYSEIVKRCVALAGEESTSSTTSSTTSGKETTSSSRHYEHPAKAIEFLVGDRGKHEPMALGGPWSPSLDGPNPATNTQTLINTAVRTVRALAGIDLSRCTQW